jgi:hypothetical protein
LFKSEGIYSLKNMENYQITTNDSKIRVPIQKERKSIEKEVIFSRRKVDRFRA